MGVDLEYTADEIAVWFSQRIVLIHCFPNGNGRHSRLIADVFVEKAMAHPVFTWVSRPLAQARVSVHGLQSIKRRRLPLKQAQRRAM